MKRTLVLAMVIFSVVGLVAVFSQETEPDPEIQAAKEETVVIYDLGRFFGFLTTLEEEKPELAFSKNQLEAIYKIVMEIKNSERIEAEWADERLTFLEDEVLTVEQLIEVDQLIIAREENRVPQEKGTGTGSGPISSYVAGGAFNPIIDETKTMGEDFAEFFELISKKLGK